MSQYVERHCERMDAFHQGLWRHPELTTTLLDDTASSVIAYLVCLACRSQNTANILIGRRALTRIPVSWLCDGPSLSRSRIHAIAANTLDMTDEWECRRLLELYCCVNEPLAHDFATECAGCPNPAIVEVGRDYLGDPHGMIALASTNLDGPLP